MRLRRSPRVRLIKIGLGNVNSTVGAFAANIDRCIEQARGMAAEGVTVGLFPEQVIGGYPPEDLIQWQGFVDNQWTELERFAAATARLPTVFVLGVAVAFEGLRYNCAAVVSGGQIDGLVPKEKLPTYSIYYEGRTVAHGSANLEEEHRGVPFGDYIFTYDFGTIAVEVCEDIWSPDGPMKRRTYAGAELVCNISASVYRVGIQATRRELIATRAADHQCTIAYVNLVGANDGLLFDGGGYVNQNGKLMLEAPRWRQGVATAVVDLDRTSRLRTENTTWRDDQETYLREHDLPRTIEMPASEFSTAEGRATLTYPVPAHRSFFLTAPGTPRSPREELCEDILDALSMGVGDYFEKIGAFKQIGVSLSGGRDSLLTLLVAHRYALRVYPDKPGKILRAFYQPSRYSSAETRKGAETICEELGIPLEVVSIDEAFEREREVVQ